MPAKVSGVVLEVDNTNGLLLLLEVDDGTVDDVEVAISPFTTRYNKTDDEFSLDKEVVIEVGDTVTGFGLDACVVGEGPARLTAFMVVVEKAEPL